MTRAYFSIVLQAPVDTVWEVLGSFENLANFVEKLADGEIEGGGGPVVGSIRRLNVVGAGVARATGEHG